MGQEPLSSLREQTNKMLDAVSKLFLKKKFTGQQTFELHWRDGALVDVYESVRSKMPHT